MRLIDADELMEHVWRDKLDSRELIAKMIDDAPTVKEISTKIPINVFERLFSQEPKTGHWIFCEGIKGKDNVEKCSCCQSHWKEAVIYRSDTREYLRTRLLYCPNCGAKMIEPQESEDQGSCENVAVTHKSLCDSCATKGCIFQSGIVRNHCDFFKTESEVEK